MRTEKQSFNPSAPTPSFSNPYLLIRFLYHPRYRGDCYLFGPALQEDVRPFPQGGAGSINVIHQQDALSF